MAKVKRNYYLEEELADAVESAAVGKRRGRQGGASGIVEQAVRDYLQREGVSSLPSLQPLSAEGEQIVKLLDGMKPKQRQAVLTIIHGLSAASPDPQETTENPRGARRAPRRDPDID